MVVIPTQSILFNVPAALGRAPLDRLALHPKRADLGEDTLEQVMLRRMKACDNADNGQAAYDGLVGLGFAPNIPAVRSPTASRRPTCAGTTAAPAGHEALLR
jgi:hypothetical protein